MWRYYLPLRDGDEVFGRNRPNRTQLMIDLGYCCHSRSRTEPIPPPHSPGWLCLTTSALATVVKVLVLREKSMLCSSWFGDDTRL